MRRREKFQQNLSEKVFYCLLLLHSTSNNIYQLWQLVRRARQPLFSHFPHFNLVDQISHFLHPLLTLNTSDLLFWQWPCMIFDQLFGTDFVEKCVSGHWQWQWQVWVCERRSLKRGGRTLFTLVQGGVKYTVHPAFNWEVKQHQINSDFTTPQPTNTMLKHIFIWHQPTLALWVSQLTKEAAGQWRLGTNQYWSDLASPRLPCLDSLLTTDVSFVSPKSA